MQAKRMGCWTRRAFVRRSASAIIVATLPELRYKPSDGRRVSWPALAPHVGLYDPRVKALALSVVDAARSAGARYADVRITATTERTYMGGAPGESIVLGLSARALVNGYWGWAARADLTTDAGPWVARKAVQLAKANAVKGPPRTVDLGTVPVVQDGVWTTPIEIDPFDVPVPEVLDWLCGAAAHIVNIGRARGDANTQAAYGWGVDVRFERQERVFASSEGSYVTQTIYVTRPQMAIGMYRAVPNIPLEINEGRGGAQAGWEYLSRIPLDTLVRQTMDEVDASLATRRPQRPLEIGQYDLVLPARVMAQLVNGTFGNATELDRALGYEANAGGTSYLGPDPFAYLGTAVAAPIVTVRATRSAPRALATVHWDEEGVVPEDFCLVRDGLLVDYQTTREQASWLAPYYQHQQLPVRSHGCAAAPDALALPMQHHPNLILQPGTVEYSFEDLIAGLDHGLVVNTMELDMDFQASSGIGLLREATEVRRGKRVAERYGQMAVRLSAPMFWKQVKTLGGPKSLQWTDGGQSIKGEPGQSTECSLAAVPALVAQQAIVDPQRAV